MDAGKHKFGHIEPSVRWLVVLQGFQNRVSPFLYPRPWPGQDKSLLIFSLLSGHGLPQITSSGQSHFFLPYPQTHDCASSVPWNVLAFLLNLVNSYSSGYYLNEMARTGIVPQSIPLRLSGLTTPFLEGRA